MKSEENMSAWRKFWHWWFTPGFYYRTDPRAMIVLAVAAIAFMIFGGLNGLLWGAVILWYLATIIIPVLIGDRLDKRFGSTWGTIIAFAPLWVPIVLGLTAGLWLPLFGVH